MTCVRMVCIAAAHSVSKCGFMVVIPPENDCDAQWRAYQAQGLWTGPRRPECAPLGIRAAPG